MIDEEYFKRCWSTSETRFHSSLSIISIALSRSHKNEKGDIRELEKKIKEDILNITHSNREMLDVVFNVAQF